MNRQLRRANEKSDKRRERDQEKRKTNRRRVSVTPVKSSAAKSSADAEPAKPSRPAPGTRRRGLAGAYLLLTIGVLALQAVLPQQTDTLSLVVHALFYVILGYFACLWLLRRGLEQGFVVAIIFGILLAASVEAAKLLVPGGAPDVLLVYLAAPGLLLGAWLGRFVFRRG